MVNKMALGIIGKESKRCAFFDEAEVDGLKSPSHIYETNVKIVKPKIFGTTIYKGSTGRMDVSPKKTTPAPGFYETDASFFKTQLKFKNIKFAKTKKSGFFDAVELASKRVPGVGSYKQSELAYDKLSRSPKANKSVRLS